MLAAPQHVVLCRDRTTTTTVNKALRLRRGARTLRPGRFHALSEVARETPRNQAVRDQGWVILRANVRVT